MTVHLAARSCQFYVAADSLQSLSGATVSHPGQSGANVTVLLRGHSLSAVHWRHIHTTPRTELGERDCVAARPRPHCSLGVAQPCQIKD